MRPSHMGRVIFWCTSGFCTRSLFFNLYINDLFHQFVNTNVCNLADDITPYLCDSNLVSLPSKLESVISYYMV